MTAPGCGKRDARSVPLASSALSTPMGVVALTAVLGDAEAGPTIGEPLPFGMSIDNLFVGGAIAFQEFTTGPGLDLLTAVEPLVGIGVPFDPGLPVIAMKVE